ncbi:hypothetical protein B0T19DRAFT_293771 [Cercophora scortea]|uniref:Uncharacterized protein n=1 Tax=Cercophora scortea TaxID=314031 RepID=A0AAE0I4T2_9PEZI|nr:hypothetical protein B0T19DRAFT_293771 [Cercophora scortea]
MPNDFPSSAVQFFSAHSPDPIRVFLQNASEPRHRKPGSRPLSPKRLASPACLLPVPCRHHHETSSPLRGRRSTPCRLWKVIPGIPGTPQPRWRFRARNGQAATHSALENKQRGWAALLPLAAKEAGWTQIQCSAGKKRAGPPCSFLVVGRWIDWSGTDGHSCHGEARCPPPQMRCDGKARMEDNGGFVWPSAAQVRCRCRRDVERAVDVWMDRVDRKRSAGVWIVTSPSPLKRSTAALAVAALLRHSQMDVTSLDGRDCHRQSLHSQSSFCLYPQVR